MTACKKKGSPLYNYYGVITHLMYGVKVRREEVGVVVAHLALDHRRDSLQSHSRVHVLLRQNLQLPARLSGQGRGEGEEGGGAGRGRRERVES